MSFPPESRERLGHYVYALCDPRIDRNDPQRIFYVGKGVGDRCFSHAKGEIDSLIEGRNTKINLIQEIRHSTNCDPIIEIIVHALDDREATRVEAHLINLLPGLTNIASGHRHEDYWLTAEEINSRYAQPVPRRKIEGVILFVSLNRTYPEASDSPELLKQRTLGDWAIKADKARQVDHIIGVYRQLVRVIFTVRKKSSEPSFQTIYPEKEGQQIRQRWLPSSVFRNDHLEQDLSLRTIIDTNGVIMTKFGQRGALFSD